MRIVLPTLAVAFAAFCVWLGVRIFNRRERWAKWVAVALVMALLAYPLSYGPIVYLAGNYSESIPESAGVILEWYFFPLEWVKNHGPDWLRWAIEKYEIFWDSV